MGQAAARVGACYKVKIWCAMLSCSYCWQVAHAGDWQVMAGPGFGAYHPESAHVVDSLNQSSNVAETEGERLLAAGVVGSLRNVVRN